uniref:Protein Wnt n=1 Tax=Glossina palpalis gambiensis TaxID=67801 RepID=A0A1B0BRQ6_9MUSC
MDLGIAKVGEPNNISPISSSIMYMDPAIHSTLRRKQRRLVRDNPGVLGALVKGANLAISECQHQFRNRRWNCSTRNFLRGKNLFGKIVDRVRNMILKKNPKKYAQVMKYWRSF